MNNSAKPFKVTWHMGGRMYSETFSDSKEAHAFYMKKASWMVPSITGPGFGPKPAKSRRAKKV